MVVVRHTTGGAYILAEPSSAISALRYTAFRVIPYHARSTIIPSVEEFVSTSRAELDKLSKQEQVSDAATNEVEDPDTIDDPGPSRSFHFTASDNDPDSLSDQNSNGSNSDINISDE
ncbi:hypothetical protein ACEPAI_2196 [Sanghuangporus weigelae]